jgi:CRISPR/Cas system CMR subunit Cmr6 (Cas7 group RAMP superfamily)
MTIYDAIAAADNGESDIRLEDRLKKSREYLRAKATGPGSDDIRSGWAIQRLEATHFSDWEKLAVPGKKRPNEIEELLKILPVGSWVMQFTFTLATPYLSKGIEDFDLLDNPIVRDKAFGVPIVPASSWKGGLRAAAVMQCDGNQQDQRVIRLFGNERLTELFRAGRLHCFPTGFAKTACQVINPHDRARRVGTLPIFLECVPADEPGTFTALYVPFGERTPGDAADDLALFAEAVKDLLLIWGIGAKKSDGNGLAKDQPMPISYYPHKQQTPTPPPKPGSQTLTSLSQLGGVDLGQGTRIPTDEIRKETFAGIIKKVVPEMVGLLNGGKR